MHVLDPIECFYLTYMRRWQITAPPDRHRGLLGGQPAENSQVARLACVINIVASAPVAKTFARLEHLTVKRDGSSYVSRDTSRMESPYPLWDEWFLEGCISLPQKLTVVRQLKQLGLSPAFIESAESFVANDDITRYFPTLDEQEEIVRRLERQQSRQDH